MNRLLDYADFAQRRDHQINGPGGEAAQARLEQREELRDQVRLAQELDRGQTPEAAVSPVLAAALEGADGRTRLSQIDVLIRSTEGEFTPAETAEPSAGPTGIAPEASEPDHDNGPRLFLI